MNISRFGIDTNVLIFAHMPALAEHGAVRAYMTELVARGETQLLVTPTVLHEFVHVITDSRRFEPPVPMSEATALARSYLERSNVEYVPVTAEAMAMALDFVDRHGLGRKRISDMVLAATYLQSGIDGLITCDTGGFTFIEGLRIIDPRSGTGS